MNDADKARCAEAPEPIENLVERVVTGDGAQLENLYLSDAEWSAAAMDVFGPDYVEHFEVTMRFATWMKLVAIARVVGGGGPVTFSRADVIAEMRAVMTDYRQQAMSPRYSENQARLIVSIADLIQRWSRMLEGLPNSGVTVDPTGSLVLGKPS